MQEKLLPNEERKLKWMKKNIFLMTKKKPWKHEKTYFCVEGKIFSAFGENERKNFEVFLNVTQKN